MNLQKINMGENRYLTNIDFIIPMLDFKQQIEIDISKTSVKITSDLLKQMKKAKQIKIESDSTKVNNIKITHKDCFKNAIIHYCQI
jgi:hypothetical protein